VATEVIIATSDFAVGYFPDGVSPSDQVLREAIERRGHPVVPAVWGAPVDQGATVVLRATWDYVDDPQRFLAWLDHLDDQGATVHNPTTVVRWNMHKRYLLDLEARGVPIVPTRLLARSSPVRLDDVARATGWDDVVVKPAVGATARLTIHQAREGREQTAAHLATLLAAEDVLVQPFVPSIVADGEVSIMAVAGTPTHAVRKRAKPGDWRVQVNFGGTDERIDLDDELVSTARRVLDALDQAPKYARVDVARFDGELHLMELELIEPDLYLDLAPEKAELLAEAVLAPTPGRARAAPQVRE
jgi:glutathione synthase/RimK-type ligase-like ATP-grasp enzyme